MIIYSFSESINASTASESCRLADLAARKQALDTTHSFIVEAPAGSGKTGLLIQRYLALLATAEQPEECLAITFTRKAAAEMRERVLQALHQASITSYTPTTKYAKTTWQLAQKVLTRNENLSWHLLENIHRMKIQTIDSLSMHLSTSMPLMSRLGAVTRITENPVVCYEQAAMNLIESVAHDPPWISQLQTLLKHVDNDVNLLIKLLAEMLKLREQWLPHIGFAGAHQQTRVIIERSIKKVVIENLEKVVSTIPDLGSEIIELAKFAAHQLMNQEKDTQDLVHCQFLSCEWPGASLEDLPLWQGLTELLLNKEGGFRKTVTTNQGFPAKTAGKTTEEKNLYSEMKSQMMQCLEKLEGQKAFNQALNQLRVSPPPYLVDKQWYLIEALVAILPQLTAELMVVFQTTQQVDFPEVLLASLRGLTEEEGNPSYLALKLDYQLRHILVDEFQDTSISQYRLLEKLTLGWARGEGRSLFLVGDPMQSIYRFRQAEVGLFIRAKTAGINDIPLIPLKLSTNFRSTSTLVHWVNQHFEKVFPENEDCSLGAIPFSASNPLPEDGMIEKDVSAESDSFGTTEVEMIHAENQAEAEKIVSLVQAARAQNPTGSIALLVRARSHLPHILSAFARHQILYQGMELEPLDARPVIQDLLSLTRALVHLGDRIAWLSLFRSPVAKLSLTDLHLLASYAPHLPLWWTLHQHSTLSSLSEAAQNTLARVIPIFQQALSEKGQQPLSVWIRNTWQALTQQSGRYVYPMDEQTQFEVDAFFSIVEQLSNKQILEAEGLISEFERRFASPYTQQPEAVSVMTIHKAKGLEFDTVIVAGLDKALRADVEKLLLWEERLDQNLHSYLLLAPMKGRGEDQDPIYHYLKLQNKQRLDFESQRLLYVAATRARKRLYWLSSQLKPNCQQVLG